MKRLIGKVIANIGEWLIDCGCWLVAWGVDTEAAEDEK